MLKFILLLLAGYLFLISLLFIFQRNYIYFPDRNRPVPNEWSVPGIKIIKLKTKDGFELESWYQPASKDLPMLVYFQGNAGHIGHRSILVKPYLDEGYGVLLVGYRGYGGNPGTPKEEGLYQDARAVMDFLKQQQVKPQCIVLFGESLGSGIAVQMASEHQVAALILQTPYTSMADIAHIHYPYVPARWLLWDRYDSKSKIKNLNIPILILQGEDDRIVPKRISAELYAAANQPKQIKYYPNKGHNDLWSEQLAEDVKVFLRRDTDC